MPLEFEFKIKYDGRTRSLTHAHAITMSKFEIQISRIAAHLDLPLHGDAEERDEVHDEYGPEDGDVEELEEGAGKGDDRGLGGRVPELELWQPSDEGPELVRLPRGEGHAVVAVVRL